MQARTIWPVLCLVVAGGLCHGLAAPLAAAEPAPSTEATAPKAFTTRHTIELGGETVAYQALAGETILRDDDGAAEASIFSISYLLDRGATDEAASRRPITFLFNGGPGSSAAWLHLAAFGPRRLVLEDAAKPGAPPYELAPNPYTLLPATDMVFVDPIGTGYSRALGEHEDSESWGVDADASVLARFVRAYLAEHHRWASPKYLLGESYGTVRAALLVGELQLDVLNSTALNGVILISSALGRDLVGRAAGTDLTYVATLPTYTAVARYHHRLPDAPEDLGTLLDAARDFAAGDYLTALFQGDSLPAERRQKIAAQLHRFTGLSEEYLLRSDLRVPFNHFLKELLRNEGIVLGVHDARFEGRDPDDAGARVEWDPFLLSIAGPFVTAMNAYLATDLAADFGRPYSVFNIEISGSWKGPRRQSWGFGATDYTESLAVAAATNDDFRIFVASGYYDLATTFFGTEYTLDHSGISKDRITLRNYPSGHMVYLNLPSLAAMSDDIQEMIGGR